MEEKKRGKIHQYWQKLMESARKKMSMGAQNLNRMMGSWAHWDKPHRPPKSKKK